MLLVGDIGGTNTTIAAVARNDGRFEIVHTARFTTGQLGSVDDAIGKFQSELLGNTDFDACCLSGAGPVRDNVCRMTNTAFTIDGNRIGRTLGLPTFVINDFSAICYALPLIDDHPHIETVELPHPDGSRPKPHGPVRVVVGAGTGLGTGYLTEDRGHYVAHPSEGGHSSFAPGDGEMIAVQDYLDSIFDVRPGAEQYISGQGIRNIYAAFRQTGRLPEDPHTSEIDSLPDEQKPAEIARQAPDHPGLTRIMRLFVRMYAQYASNTALFLLPSGGLYIAGGIAAKNQEWFLRDNLFMETFERNYNDRITPLLRSTPVVLIKDYSVSLYGAAHAAVSLL